MKSLKEKLNEMCGQCGAEMKLAPGIGIYCPQKKCTNGDGPSVWMVIEKLTGGREDLYIETAKNLNLFRGRK